MTGIGNTNVRWFGGIPALCVLGLAAGQVWAGTLSGQVLKLDSTGQAGVSVALVGSQTMSTQTAADGSWSLAPVTTGIRYAVPTPVATKGRLQLENGHVKLGFQGADVSGRNPSRFSEVSFPANVAARAASAPDTLVYTWNNKVILRDTVTNLDQTGILRSFDTTVNAAVAYGYLTDSRDGHWYRTVLIGKQLWMAQNLNYKADSSWALDTAMRYGRLYSWTGALALKDSCKINSCLSAVRPPYQGICPSGWHVPDDAELDTLVKYAGAAKAGKNLKAVIGWGSSASANTDSLGFGLLPTGYRDNYGSMNNQSSATYLMSATEYTSLKLSYRYFGYMNDAITSNAMNKLSGIPVRCVRN